MIDRRESEVWGGRVVLREELDTDTDVYVSFGGNKQQLPTDTVERRCSNVEIQGPLYKPEKWIFKAEFTSHIQILPCPKHNRIFVLHFFHSAALCHSFPKSK